MADLHNDVTYKGWDKNPTAFHRECMWSTQLMLQRWTRLLRGKTDLLHKWYQKSWCISKSVQLLYWHMACEVCGSHTVRLMLSLFQKTTIHVKFLTVCLCSCSISEPKSCLCCIHSCACSRGNGRNMINPPEPMCFQRNKPGRNKPGNTAYPMCWRI